MESKADLKKKNLLKQKRKNLNNIDNSDLSNSENKKKKI